MPTSDPRLLSPISVALQGLSPTPVSLIDVGIGIGKWGLISRDLFDFMDGRIDRSEWRSEILGIEGFDGYHNPIWDFAYNTVKVGEAVDVLTNMEVHFNRTGVDLLLAFEILEHFDKNRGLQFLDACLGASKVVLLSTPLRPGEQGEVHGNTYEKHRSRWTLEELPGEKKSGAVVAGFMIAALSNQAIPPSLQLGSFQWFRRTHPGFSIPYPVARRLDAIRRRK